MSTRIISIFSGKPMDAEIICEILIDNGIQATLKNEILGSLVPWQVTSGGVNPVEVEILESDKEKALALIDEFHQSAE